MGDFPVVMFDEDTTEPEKNKQIPSEKKKKNTSSHIFPFLQGSMASPPQNVGPLCTCWHKPTCRPQMSGDVRLSGFETQEKQ